MDETDDMESAAMTTCKPPGAIPIIWQTTEAQVDALLGQAGRPVLDRELERLRRLAAKQQWPLQSIRIDYYQDEEIETWQHLVLVLQFDCGAEKAEKLWETAVEGVYQTLKGQEAELYARYIDHDFEGHPAVSAG